MAPTVAQPGLGQVATEINDTPRAYRVVFDRIGRTHNPPPLVVDADGASHLADLIYEYALPFLGSQDVEVHVAPKLGKGLIHCGIRTGGRFTVELVATAEAVSR
jgi:hypothetical protein